MGMPLIEVRKLWFVNIVEAYNYNSPLCTMYWYGFSSYAGHVSSWSREVDDRNPYQHRVEHVQVLRKF